MRLPHRALCWMSRERLNRARPVPLSCSQTLRETAGHQPQHGRVAQGDKTPVSLLGHGLRRAWRPLQQKPLFLLYLRGLLHHQVRGCWDRRGLRDWWSLRCGIRSGSL